MPEPILSPAFAWMPHARGRALVCTALSAVARHAFTTREPALPQSGADAAGDRSVLAAAIGVAPERLAILTQVHGARVVRVPDQADAADAEGNWGEGDALTTACPDVGLAVKVADCVPILLADRASGAVAAVHAGWRGTASGVTQAAVRAMAEAYGTRPADLLAAIGPSIGPCCYEVGMDVFDRFLEAGTTPDALADWFTVAPKRPDADAGGSADAPARTASLPRPGKLWLDTWQANAGQLIDAGVPASQVWISGLCSRCFPALFHSYRADGARAGRMLAGIRAASRQQAAAGLTADRGGTLPR